tara:strand:- start:415 stop:1098 length:684 start_codon:yes stop_codon:yes gene_type:complete
MPSNEITYTTRDGETFSGYMSESNRQEKAPGILLITAIFGVDDEMKELSDAWAAEGFIVSVPDIFWRVMPGPTDNLEKAFARYEAFDVEQGFRDVEDLMQTLRKHPRCNGNVGVLGYCFGGRYAQVAGSRFGANAIGAFHGTFIEQHLDEVGMVKCPVSFHFGSEDPVIPMDVVKDIERAYMERENAHIHLHANAGHNFSMPYKEGYNREVADSSRKSVLNVFKGMQ